MTSQARDWLAQPELARLWDRLRDRLQRTGLQVRGKLILADVSYTERQALGLLMGRAYPPGSVSIALPELDQRLRSGAAAAGLTAVVTDLRGPLTNRPAVRAARQSAWQQTWATAQAALVAAGLGDVPWAGIWLAEIAKSGALGGQGPQGAADLIAQAVGVLARLDGEQCGRGELAERVTGTAHGLDDSTPLAKIVLRALAHCYQVEPPQTARARRELWAVAGVGTDRVSSTVLSYGLAPLGADWPAQHLRQRAAAAAETHLTWRDVRRIEWRLPAGTEVFVCENPRVVEAAADARCGSWLVCTAGNPATVVQDLLDALTEAGAALAYRGDFDWPGVAMANRILGRYAARPWRMSAADYTEHAATARGRGTPLRPLSGPPVDAAWDTELSPAMSALGLAVQEESALDLILADLLSAGGGQVKSAGS